MSELFNIDYDEFHASLDAIKKANSYDELHDCIELLPSKYGFTMINCWQGNMATWMPFDAPLNWDMISEDPVVMMNNEASISLFMSNGLLDWKQIYFEKEYIMVDPVFWNTLFSDQPFFWDHSYRSSFIGKGQIQFMNEAKEHAMHSGWVKPFHGKGTEIGALAFFSDPEHHGQRERLEEYGAEPLDIFSYCFFSRVKQLFGLHIPPVKKIQLTARELECIRFSAVGKTSWEISVVLGISERTVKFHIANAMSKFGVHSKSHMIAKFIATGGGL